MLKMVSVIETPIAESVDENACLLGIQNGEDGKQALYQMPIDLVIRKGTGGCVALLKGFVLPVEDWKDCEEVPGYRFTLQLLDKDIHSTYYPCVTVNPTSMVTAQEFGLCTTAETFDGGMIFWAKSAPTEPISITAAFLATNTGASSVGSNYVLPVATSDTLGGIKLGTGLTSEPDGTVSVCFEFDDTIVASKQDIVEMMTDVFVGDYIPTDSGSMIATKEEITEMLTEVFTQ